LNRRLNDSDVFGLEHGIEAGHKLPIVVADQKANRFFAVGKSAPAACTWLGARRTRTPSG
jgi:hypothetical protein